MKLYSSETDQNGSAPPVADEEAEEVYDYSTLFKAPNFADFITTKPNSKAKKYEQRVQSMMKAGMIGSINAENWPDAATFIKHGPGFAKAAGNLAAEDAKAAAVIEMITAPDSPWLMFAMIAIPMVAQLARNHQSDFEEAGKTWRERRALRKQAKLSGTTTVRPPITVHLGKRTIKLPIRFRLRLPNLKKVFSAFLAPTEHPGLITQEVFNDEKVVAALHKMGLYPRESQNEQQRKAG